MKVRSIFSFDDLDLRTIRAATGQGGKATRKECVTFIDRAVRAAIKAAPDPKPARTRRPKGEPAGLIVAPLEPASARERIRRLYKH